MLNALFLVWIVSFLFQRHNIIGTLSIDNLMAPLLFIGWLFAPPSPDIEARNRRTNTIMMALAVLGVLAFIATIKLLHEPKFLGVILYKHIKDFTYVLLPVMYVRNLDMLRRTNSVLLLIGVLSCVAAVLGTLGLVPYFTSLEQGYTRIPGLIRARGFFDNLGDAALLFSYMLLVVLAFRKRNLFFGKGNMFMRVLFFLLIVGGILANQSRNILFSCVLALLGYLGFRMMFRQYNPKTRLLVFYMLIMVAIFSVVLLYFNFDAFFKTLVYIMGRSAEGTVNDRLESYYYSLMLLRKNLVFGLSANDLMREWNFILEIHNLWLSSALKDGLGGLFSIFFLCFMSLRGAIRAISVEAMARQALVIFTFMFSSVMFSSNFYPAYYSLLFWFFLGLTLSLDSVSAEGAAEVRSRSAHRRVDFDLHAPAGVLSGGDPMLQRSRRVRPGNF